MKNYRSLIAFAGLSVALFLAAEASTRIFGLTSFPIYIRDPKIGYYPAPNQSGAFLRRNRWFINDRGFENDRPFVVSHPSAMLVGDSVVYGGNPVDYEQRIEAIATKKWKGRIWVASAGGWSLLNEIAFLHTHMHELNSVDRLIFILNNGDFGPPAAWTGELAFPTRRPSVATLYLFRRYILPHPSELPMISVEDDKASQSLWSAEFSKLLMTTHAPITIILYPDQNDLKDGALWNSDTAAIRRYVAAHSNRMAITDLRADPRWNKSLYRDSIHPNLIGNKFLAEIVTDICRKNSPSE